MIKKLKRNRQFPSSNSLTRFSHNLVRFILSSLAFSIFVLYQPLQAQDSPTINKAPKAIISVTGSATLYSSDQHFNSQIKSERVSISNAKISVVKAENSEKKVLVVKSITTKNTIVQERKNLKKKATPLQAKTIKIQNPKISNLLLKKGISSDSFSSIGTPSAEFLVINNLSKKELKAATFKREINLQSGNGNYLKWKFKIHNSEPKSKEYFSQYPVRPPPCMV